MFGEGLIDGIDGSVGAAEQKFTINISKAKTKFCLSLHFSHDNSYLFFNVKKIFNKNVDSPINFVWEAYLINLMLMDLSFKRKYL